MESVTLESRTVIRSGDANEQNERSHTQDGSFYSNAKAYWSTISPTIDGMLGGYSSLNVPDIRESHSFLDEFGPRTKAYALDCGSGIGRITKQLLLPRFSRVDMVDVTQEFLDQAEAYIGSESFARVGEQFCMGLQDFTPPKGRYDLIWIQWVLGHLADLTLVAFLKRCMQSLSKTGVVVVKENVNADGGVTEKDVMSATGVEFDELDSSYTRPRVALVAAFHQAGFQLISERAQLNFPSSIYPVRMFALRPSSCTASPSSDLKAVQANANP